MFEKLGQVADRMATSVSRRQFLGGFGRCALALAAAVGGLVAFPAVAQAGTACCMGRGHCPKPAPGCQIDGAFNCGLPSAYCKYICDGTIVQVPCA